VSDSEQRPGQTGPSEAASDSPPQERLPIALSAIRVNIIIDREPFSIIESILIASIPRPGDTILLLINGTTRIASVSFCNHTPHAPTAADIAVSFSTDDLPKTAQAPVASDAVIAKVFDYHSRVFDKSSTYNNVVMTAGYAGIFAIWSLTKEYLPIHAAAVIAILTGISLILFVGWTIYGMILRAQPTIDFAKIVDKKPGDFINSLSALETADNNRVLKAAKLWMYIFVPTAVTGFAGALLLMWNMIATLLGCGVWPK
jgi:hypothetical protein